MVCGCVCVWPRWPCSCCCSRRGAGGTGAFISPLSGCRKSNARWESSWQQFSLDRSAALLQFMTKEFTTRQSQSQYYDKYYPSTRFCTPLYQAFGVTVITPAVNPLTRGEERRRTGTLLQVSAGFMDPGGPSLLNLKKRYKLCSLLLLKASRCCRLTLGKVKENLLNAHTISSAYIHIQYVCVKPVVMLFFFFCCPVSQVSSSISKK